MHASASPSPVRSHDASADAVSRADRYRWRVIDLRTRAARTSVPKWVAPGWSLVEAFVPEPIERLARKLVDDRRTLALDAAARKAYTDRIARQATDHAALADDEATR